MNNTTLVRMQDITKTFPGVVAVNKVNFNLFSNEIHTILGENGAGKTTLINILSGMYKPDEGEIKIRGVKAKIRSPYDSLRLGIGTVYQHFALIPTMTVLENLILGFEGGVVLNHNLAKQKLKKISVKFGLSINPMKKIQHLSIGERQRVEIIKILFRGADALILDEPTSVLSPLEVEDLFRILLALKKTGKGVVLITHNLHDALEISDRITILKLGKKVAEMSGCNLRDMGKNEATKKILNVMFGDMISPEPKISEKKFEETSVLKINQAEATNRQGVIGLKKVSLKIRKGEILGIAGVDGNGQRLLCEVIGGQKKAISGKIIYKGKNISHLSIRQRFELGIVYISDDRMNEECALLMTLSENAILRKYYKRPFSAYGMINNSAVNDHTKKLIVDFNIKTPGPEARIGTLSGGNIQKFVLSNGLSANPELIVCSKPTYGLDAKTRQYIQKLLLAESKRGTAVLLISTDMDELLSCSDRIGVMFNGEILDILEKYDATPEKIGKLMLGIKK